MRKYVVIYRAVFIENLQYTANIVMGFIAYLILSVVFLNLWGYMYDAPGELIAGYTKEQMIWYVMITEMIWFGARSSTVREQVAADIRGGNIAYLINKPYRYPFYILAKYTGEWNIQLSMYAGLTAVVGCTMVGTIFPVEIFPAAVQPVLKLTPIYTVCYGPAKLIVDFSVEKYLEILLAQVLYLAFGSVILLWIYERGGRKLYVNGG